MADLEWMADANCLDEDPELFFLGTPNAIEAAKEICSGCDVRAQCEQYAKDVDAEWGVWGNQSEVERHPGKHKPAPTAHERCGTYSGYTRHRKLGEGLCVPCKQAARTYEQGQRNRKRAS